MEIALHYRYNMDTIKRNVGRTNGTDKKACCY